MRARLGFAYGNFPLGFREDFYFDGVRKAGVVVFEAFRPFNHADSLFEIIGVEADFIEVGATFETVKVEVENRRVVRVFVQNGVGGGAHGARKTETFADPAANDRLACAQVPVKSHLVARLQATAKLYGPIESFFFATEFHFLLPEI